MSVIPQSLHDQAIHFLHKKEYKKLENMVTKNIVRQIGATPESIAFGYLILVDGYFAQGKHDEAREIVERLLISPSINDQIKDKLFRFLYYYITCLHPKIQEIIPWIPIDPFHFMNASLYQHNDQLISIIRATNYEKPNRQEKRHDPWNRIISRPFVYIYDKYFRVLFHKELTDISVWPRNTSQVVGYEDPRIFRFDNSYYFTATSFETQRMPKPCIVLCKLSDTWDIIQTVPLQCQDPQQMQKNWLPFVDINENAF